MVFYPIYQSKKVSIKNKNSIHYEHTRIIAGMVASKLIEPFNPFAIYLFILKKNELVREYIESINAI